MGEGGTITVQCACGKRLKAPASAVGRKAKCPSCGEILVIEAPPPEDDMSALYELAATEEEAAKRQPTAVATATMGAPAPARPVPMPVPMGGYRPPSERGPVENRLAPQASFFRGLGVCVAGGVVGGIVWFLIAYLTRWELAFLAMLIGAGAGLGMQWGQQGYSKLGGVTAALVTLFAIILAKIAVIVAVVLPMASQMLDDGGRDMEIVSHLEQKEYEKRGVDLFSASEAEMEAVQKAARARYDGMSAEERQKVGQQVQEEREKAQLAGLLVDEIIEERKLNPDDMDFAQYQVLHKLAEQRAEAMAPAERSVELKRLEAKAEAKFKAQMEQWRAQAAEAGEEAEIDGGGLSAAVSLGLFFFLLSQWKFILFLVLGVVVAYRTAAASIHG